jgi:hemerythrin
VGEASGSECHGNFPPILALPPPRGREYSGEQMAYIDWSENFSVNVRELDAHHRTLVKKINMLYQSLLENSGRETQRKIIEGMIEYANVHFAAEEKYMLRLNYPGFLKHQAAHSTFTAMTHDLQNRVNHSDFVLTLDLLSFLKGWLQDHILVNDKEYSRHFNLNGVY